MIVRGEARSIVQKFEHAFRLEREDTMPSSFWTADMVMLRDEELPLGLQLYSAWNEYNDRLHGTWFWHAPARVFRLSTEERFLLAQKSGQWLVYDKTDKKMKRMSGNRQIETYNTLVDAIKSI